MGTNYYALLNVCPHCDRPERKLHIGKSSGGWCFGLRVYEGEDGPNNWADWMALLTKPGTVNKIKNEYGEYVLLSELVETVTQRKGSPEPDTNRRDMGEGSWYDARVGLWRHRHGGAMAGEGTFDLCPYEFS